MPTTPSPAASAWRGRSHTTDEPWPRLVGWAFAVLLGCACWAVILFAGTLIYRVVLNS